MAKRELQDPEDHLAQEDCQEQQAWMVGTRFQANQDSTGFQEEQVKQRLTNLSGDSVIMLHLLCIKRVRIKGADGIPGRHGKDGKDGENGQNAANGKDGNNNNVHYKYVSPELYYDKKKIIYHYK